MTAKSATTKKNNKSNGFTAEERAAMKERARQLKAERAGQDAGESEVRAKIAEMGASDRAIAERLHAIVTASAPALAPRRIVLPPRTGSSISDTRCCNSRRLLSAVSREQSDMTMMNSSPA